MLGFILGTIVGGVLGVFFMCLVQVGHANRHDWDEQ